jgi:nucleoside-diphosphate-sugar epimerase
MDLNSIALRRILVTGADGFIGRRLCDAFASQGIAHVGAVRATTAQTDAQNRVALGDFAAADWDRALVDVDAIVHLAGRAHVTESDRDPTPHIVANVHVTRRLLEAARRARVRRVVLASTVKIYGENTRPGRPFRAGDPSCPHDAYAHSKVEAENVLWQAAREDGIEGVVLRLPLVYGPRVTGNFGLLVEAVAARRRLPFANVTNRRSLLYVDNAVSAIAAALRVPELAGQTLPVADAEAVSTPELIRKIAGALGVAPRLSRMPISVLRFGASLTGRRNASRRLLGSLEVDAQQFGALAGWTPPHTLDEGIAATGVWWRSKQIA